MIAAQLCMREAAPKFRLQPTASNVNKHQRDSSIHHSTRGRGLCGLHLTLYLFLLRLWLLANVYDCVDVLCRLIPLEYAVSDISMLVEQPVIIM